MCSAFWMQGLVSFWWGAPETVLVQAGLGRLGVRLPFSVYPPRLVAPLEARSSPRRLRSKPRWPGGGSLTDKTR